MPKIKLIVEGGSMKPGPAVAQQLGPMGINLGKVIEDVNRSTANFKGTKVPVELDVDPKTRTYKIEIFSPPMAELIKKELQLEKASGEAGKTIVGNIAFETIIKIAKTKLPNLLAKDLRAAVKLTVGTCVSLGVLIDSKSPIEINKEIQEGKFDILIKEEKTEPSEEKLKELAKVFAEIKTQQEKKKKALEEAKAAEEAAKAAAATATAPAAGTPAAATATAAAATPEKTPAKKEAPKKEAAAPAKKK